MQRDGARKTSPTQSVKQQRRQEEVETQMETESAQPEENISADTSAQGTDQASPETKNEKENKRENKKEQGAIPKDKPVLSWAERTKEIQENTSASRDVNKVFTDIKDVITSLTSVRQKIEVHHAKWFTSAKQIAERLGVPVSKPRTCEVQRNRDNAPADTVEEYFRRNLTVPFVDHVLNELKTRFGNAEQETSMQCMFAVPSILLESKETWEESFRRFSTYHEESLPSRTALEAEMTMWERWCERQDAIPTSALGTLNAMDHVLYPNISTCLKLFCTIPITTCECERNVSALRRLKTYWRSTMSQTRLTGLVLMHIHYDMPIDVDVIINRFATLHPRRMEVEDIL